MNGTMYYMAKDQQGKDYKEPVGEITLSVVEGADNRLANAQKIDTLARGINNLSTNTFQSAYVDYSYNINDVIIEEQ